MKTLLSILIIPVALSWLPALALVGESEVALPQVDSGRLERLADFPSQKVAERHVEVWLPESYDGRTPHAVLYMLDGQMLFDGATTWNGQEWRMDEVAGELMASGEVRPFIVVGIWNAGPARYVEYLPQRAFESLPAAERKRIAELDYNGGKLLARAPYADTFLDFVTGELKPYIDRRYATDPAREATFIGGSSMGGLISWYAVWRHPEVFGGAACLSTHWAGLRDNQNQLAEALLAYFQKAMPESNRHKLYFDHGDTTLDALYPPLQARADNALKAAGFDASHWQTAVYPGADHSEKAWAERLDTPLKFLFGVR